MRHAIRVLDDKCLIKAYNTGGVTCHDLIENMGKEIVRLESKKLEERSRLWLLEDIIQVLEQDKVSKADIYD
jgi:predicted transcriptional regulator